MSKKLREQDDLLDETFGEEGAASDEVTRKATPEPEEDEQEVTSTGEEQVEHEEEEPDTGDEEVTEPEVDETELDSFLQDRVDVTDEEEEPETGDEEEPAEPETDEISLDLDEDTFDEITASPERFVEYINKVKQSAFKEAQAEMKQEIANAKEEILKNIPEVVQKSATRAQTVEQLRTNFLKENPGLQNKLPYVRDMTATIATQNPDWSAKQVLDEVAKRANRDLNLSEQAEEREKKRTTDPKFAGAGGRRSPSSEKDTRTKQERLLDQTFG